MIIWSGWGILTPLILILAFVLSLILFPGDHFALGFGFTFLSAGAFNWYFGKKWNEKPGRVMVDKETGEEVELKSKHTLFWIKMQYWGYLFVGIGALFLVSLLF